MKRGRGAAGKTLVAVAVERRDPTGFRRCRLRVIPNTQARTLRAFLLDGVEPGAVIVTDGLPPYPPAIANDFVHQPVPVGPAGGPAQGLLPGVHRVASLLKRWLLGTHQGAVDADHLQGYLDEFAFRCNRRRSEFRGLLFRRLLEQGVQVGPVTYQSLVVHPAAKGTHPHPPPSERRAGPASLAVAPATRRPWRAPNR